jgi:twinkle protein
MNLNGFEIEVYNQYGFDLQGKTSGKIQTTCVFCSADRKKKNDKCCTVNLETGFYNCHHCTVQGQVHKYKSKKKKYIRPTSSYPELAEKFVQFFKKRGINEKTLQQYKISGQKNIQFPYFRDEELINIKYRSEDKKFMLSKDAELIFYGLDDIKDEQECIIVEGEIDKLSFAELGIYNVISVPNGAVLNLQYLDNCIKYFDNKQKIWLAVDTDDVGIKLRDELGRRLGFNRCFIVDFKDCKDANEYLIKYNNLDIFETGKQFPIEGCFTVEDFKDELYLLHKEGLKKGKTLNIPILDDLISFQEPFVYTISGIPSHGKSDFIDFVLVKLSLLYNLRFAYFSPENRPLQLHGSKIISKIAGQRFDVLNLNDLDLAFDYIKDKFWFIKPSDNFEVDTILEMSQMLVTRHGISALVIDPYNKLEHKIPSGLSETNYVSKFYDKVLTFADRYNIIVFIVAHPTKLKKQANGLFEVPTLYDISGSANFYNKTDFGLCVYRNMLTEMVEIHIQKAKFRHLGMNGQCEFKYNLNNGRYTIGEWDNSNWLINTPEEPLENDFVEIQQEFDEMPF